MAEELVFYTHPMSRGRIVRWMLEETGAPYRAEIVEYGPPMKSPEYRAINPMAKVPAIRRGDTVVTECAGICAWLADAYPQAGLAPAPAERAAYYRWLFFAAGPLEAAVTNRSLGVEVPEDKQSFVGYGDYGLVLDTLEGAVSGVGFVAGPAFSATDVYVASHLAFGMRFGGIEKRPAFETYVTRATDRPAFRRAAELDEAAMPAQPAAG